LKLHSAFANGTAESSHQFNKRRRNEDEQDDDKDEEVADTEEEEVDDRDEEAAAEAVGSQASDGSLQQDEDRAEEKRAATELDNVIRDQKHRIKELKARESVAGHLIIETAFENFIEQVDKDRYGTGEVGRDFFGRNEATFVEVSAGSSPRYNITVTQEEFIDVMTAFQMPDKEIAIKKCRVFNLANRDMMQNMLGSVAPHTLAKKTPILLLIRGQFLTVPDTKGSL